jgi:hypothetical protein
LLSSIHSSSTLSGMSDALRSSMHPSSSIFGRSDVSGPGASSGNSTLLSHIHFSSDRCGVGGLGATGAAAVAEVAVGAEHPD